MKHFLQRIAAISLVFFIILMIVIVGFNMIIRQKANFKINREDTVVVFGHSHVECAYNDSLISNFKNLGASGESYFYTLPKVKNILKQNRQIKFVLIEFTNNQITESMDRWIWGNVQMADKYSIYSPFLTKEDNQFLATKNISGFIGSLSAALKKTTFYITTNDYSYSNRIGGYLYLHQSKLDSFLTIHKMSSNIVPNTSLSVKNIECLREIIWYCQKDNRQIALIRTPQHKIYPDNKNEAVFQSVRNKYFDTIPFLDFVEFSLDNDEFADWDHLNYKGACKYSLWFDHLLKEGLLTEKYKQQIYNRGQIVKNL